MRLGSNITPWSTLLLCSWFLACASQDYPEAGVTPNSCSCPKGACDGWALVTFDISDTGAVENPRLDDSCPVGGPFGTAAMNAVSKWKYKSGARKAVRVRLDFEREE